MNQEIKQKWTAALRSGKYQQAKRYLHTDGGYCCLGVLCDLIDPTGWREGPNKRVSDFEYGGDSRYQNPPAKVVEQAGIDWTAVNRLMDMNDDEGKSFVQIADYIEATL